MVNEPYRPGNTDSPRILFLRKEHLEALKKAREEITGHLKDLDGIEEWQHQREEYLADFYRFTKEVLGFKELYEPLHRPLCDQISNEKILRSLWLLPRGHFKTTIISISYPLWILCRNQDARVALISKSASKAEENLEEIVDRARRPEFQEFFGDTIGHPDNWPICRKDRIKIARKGSTTGPSIAAYSTESSEVGRHFDYMVFDDIVDQENVSSEHTRSGIWEWLGRQFAVCDPGRKIIVVGTRWHWDDVYSRISKKFPRRDKANALGWHVIKRQAIENEKPIFPTRFTREVLSELKQVMGDYIYSCFYNNDPSGEGTNPFDRRRFTWIQYPKHLEESWTYILVDPAGTKEEYSSYTGIIIGDAQGDRTFVVRRAILEKMYPHELIEKLLGLVESYKPHMVIIEDEAYQKAIFWWLRQEMLRRKMSFPIQLIKNPRNVGQEFRLLALQPFLHSGRIRFAANMEGRADLVEEFECYPKGPHRDLICALWFATQIYHPAMKMDKKEQEKLDPRLRLLSEMMTRRQRVKGALAHLREA